MTKINAKYRKRETDRLTEVIKSREENTIVVEFSKLFH